MSEQYVPPLRPRDCGAGAMTREYSEAEREILSRVAHMLMDGAGRTADAITFDIDPTCQRMPRITNRAPADDPRARLRAHLRPNADWYKIRNNVVAGAADVYIYDEIGYFGITAQQFVTELTALNVSTINLHVNSPGGEVYDGIAIYNTLKQHRATVNVYVDGLAASIASVIAMAGDTVTMGRGSHMMIHEAQGFAMGPAEEMRRLADELDAHTLNIAGFYQARAGGDVEAWRTAMAATTWYTAEEAVSAGLADSVANADRPADAGVPANTWDLSIFGGVRAAATRPASAPPHSAEPTPTEPEREEIDWGAVIAGWDPEIVRASLDLARERVDTTLPPNPPPESPAQTNDGTADYWIIDPAAFHNALRGGLEV